MIVQFFTRLVSNVSEEVLTDLFRIIIREIMLARDKGQLHKSVAGLKLVLDEVARHEEMSDEEKNALLSAAGAGIVNRLRND